MLAPRSIETLLRRRWAAAIVLIALVGVAYVAVRKAGFIWDDDQHLTANPCIVGPLNLASAWTTPEANYFPLVLTTVAALHRVFGLNPLVFHVFNLLLHAVNVLLLWQLLARLKVRGAWLGAALWGLHPVMAETVAWVSETTNTQSCLFFLLSLGAFLRWLTRPGERGSAAWYAVAWVAAAGAMLSKPSTVMLPVVFVLCGGWLKTKWRRRQLVGLIPFFGLAGAWSLWTIWEQKFHSGAIGAEWTLSFLQRSLLAGCDVWFYLAKIAWPVGLSFVYPRWTLDPASPLLYVPLLAAVALGIWLTVRRQVLRPIAFAAAAFVVLLFPVLGFFDVYYFRFSFVADHFQYLASMAPLALLGAWLAGTQPWRLGTLRTVAAAVLVVAFMGLTYFHAAEFSGDERLWRTTLARDPSCWMAHSNLGLVLQNKPRGGDLTGAIEHFQAAIGLKPDYVEAHYNLANAYSELPGHDADAITEYETALRYDPNYAMAHENLGNVLARQPGRDAGALVHFQAAVRLRPDWSYARSNLASQLAKNPSRRADALREYAVAAQLSPDNPDLHYNYANALLAEPGRLTAAVAEYQAALRLKPQFGQAEFNLGVALAGGGDIPRALPHFERAFGLMPENAASHLALAQLLERDAAWADRAIAEYETAARLDPAAANVHNDVAVLYAKKGELANAARHLEAALQIDPANATARDNLAAVRAALAK